MKKFDEFINEKLRRRKSYVDSKGRNVYVPGNNLTLTDEDVINGKCLKFKGFEVYEGSLHIEADGLTSLEGFPSVITGSFRILKHSLNSLKGCPQEIGQDFVVGNNGGKSSFDSLIGGPKKVGATYEVISLDLKSLKGAPILVKGHFNCSENELSSLDGAPKKIGGNFDCSYNALKNLIGFPTKVGKDIDISSNEITSLQGVPETIKGDFNCSYNMLPNFIGGPKKVKGNFSAPHNEELTSLQGSPEEVGIDFDVAYTSLKNLTGCPALIKEDLVLKSETLETIKGIGKIIGNIHISGRNNLNPIDKYLIENSSFEKGGYWQKLYDNLLDSLVKIDPSDEFYDRLNKEKIKNYIASKKSINKFDL